MLHIVHSPRFTLLAPMKPTFGIGTSDQRFGYSSPTKLSTNSFGGNRSFYSVECWAAVVLCFLETIQVSNWTSLSDSFLLHRRLLLLDVVCPMWWYTQ